MSKIIILVLLIGIVGYFFYKTKTNNDLAIENAAQGKSFLQENKQRDGVKVTSTGLQYEVLVSSEDTLSPLETDTVLVHYHGTLIDGSVFDSSVERGSPISFPLNKVIKGWTEGVQLMHKGDKFRFFIPPDLAYGKQNAGAIGPNSTLIFDVELIDINAK